MWPAVLPEITEYLAVGPHLLDDGTLQVDPLTAQERTYEVPEELYLRQVLDLDPDSDTALLDFTNTYGLLAIPYDDLDRLSMILGSPMVPAEGVDLEPRSTQWEVVETELRLRSRHATTRQVGASIRIIKRLTSIFAKWGDNAASVDEVETLAVALEFLLSPFSPIVSVISDDDEVPIYDLFADRQLRLEHILGLQLARHISIGDTYKTCHNEPCGRLFVHQLGRAEHGQNRSTGVLFCSKACAKAQTERNRRRRNRQTDN